MKINAFVRLRPCQGYSIVEAMVAISILMLGVGAAASISMTMSTQEEINARTARAVNWQENAARLFQLGIGTDSDVSDIVALMPGLPGIESGGLAVSTAVTDVDTDASGTFPVDVSTLTLTYGSVDDTATTRSNVMKIVRY